MKLFYFSNKCFIYSKNSIQQFFFKSKFFSFRPLLLGWLLCISNVFINFLFDLQRNHTYTVDGSVILKFVQKLLQSECYWCNEQYEHLLNLKLQPLWHFLPQSKVFCLQFLKTLFYFTFISILVFVHKCAKCCKSNFCCQ